MEDAVGEAVGVSEIDGVAVDGLLMLHSVIGEGTIEEIELVVIIAKLMC